MKLAFCIFKYYPYGGLERDFLRIAKACQQRGHQIYIYTMQWDGEIPSGVNIRFIKIHNISNHRRALNFAAAIPTYLKQDKPDVVIGFNRMPHLDIYFAGDSCYQAQAQNKYGILTRFLPRHRAYISLENAIFSKAANTEILLLTPHAQNDFIGYYQTAKKRFHVMPPGVAPDRIFPENHAQIREQVRQEYHLTDQQYLLLMIGSDFKRKGVDRALNGVASLPQTLKDNVKLMIIGKGDAKPYLHLAQQLNIQKNVLFMDGRQDIMRFLIGADILLHPAYQETAGMVLLEALVARLPVLVTANCGYASYIEASQAGLLITQPFQQQELNSQLHQMLNKEHLQRYQSNAKDYVNKNDLFSLTDKVADFIETIAKQKMETHA